MPTWIWLVIICAIFVLWYLWSEYAAMYRFAADNPEAVGVAQSVSRYYTDIAGLVGAYQAYDSADGNFQTRMGRFFGALPK